MTFAFPDYFGEQICLFSVKKTAQDRKKPAESGKLELFEKLRLSSATHQKSIQEAACSSREVERIEADSSLSSASFSS